MHYSDWILPAIIILYAIFEYHKREQLHRERMELLKRNIVPPPIIRIPTLTTITTTAIVALLLFGTSILFVGLSFREKAGSMALLPLAIMFTTIFIFLFLMLKRDIKIYRANSKRQEAQC